MIMRPDELEFMGINLMAKILPPEDFVKYLNAKCSSGASIIEEMIGQITSFFKKIFR